MKPPRKPLDIMKNTSIISNGSVSKTVKPFFTPASALPSDPSSSTVSQNQNQPHPTLGKNAQKEQKSKKMLPEADMAAFKKAIEGSDLSKVGLIEVLKKKFPGRQAAAIKGTLESVAKREGQKEMDKRWVLIA
jgi:chromatin assembly factor 1 subunit A